MEVDDEVQKTKASGINANGIMAAPGTSTLRLYLRSIVIFEKCIP